MDTKKTLDLLCENAVDIISKDEFKARLESALEKRTPLRVKAGFDPSAPDIHLGHTVLLRKLRQFQDLGHKVVFIIGDYTALVGDPTGQTKTRPALSRAQIEENAKTYQDQAFKILDKDPKKIEMVYNSQWLDGPEMFRILFQQIGPHVTVDQLLVRDDFDKRRKAHRPIAFRELIYPILQGYDSVRIKADIELGGTDQKFNLLMGRDLQSQFGQQPQIVMTFPLLVGLDGAQKMSKSLGNYIAVNDTPKDVFGKAMSIPDALMPMYFNLLTCENGGQIQADVDSGKLHPRDAKVRLAKNLTDFLHGKSAAEKEAEEFDRVFKEKKTPDELPLFEVSDSKIWIVDLLRNGGLVQTGADARRLIEQGAVELDGNRIQDSKQIVEVKNGSILKVGKRGYLKLVVKKSR